MVLYHPPAGEAAGEDVDRAIRSLLGILMKKGVLAHRAYGSRSLQLAESPARELARLILSRYPSDREAGRLAERVLGRV